MAISPPSYHIRSGQVRSDGRRTQSKRRSPPPSPATCARTGQIRGSADAKRRRVDRSIVPAPKATNQPPRPTLHRSNQQQIARHARRADTSPGAPRATTATAPDVTGRRTTSAPSVSFDFSGFGPGSRARRAFSFRLVATYLPAVPCGRGPGRSIVAAAQAKSKQPTNHHARDPQIQPTADRAPRSESRHVAGGAATTATAPDVTGPSVSFEFSGFGVSGATGIFLPARRPIFLPCRAAAVSRPMGWTDARTFTGGMRESRVEPRARALEARPSPRIACLERMITVDRVDDDASAHIYEHL